MKQGTQPVADSHGLQSLDTCRAAPISSWKDLVDLPVLSQGRLRSSGGTHGEAMSGEPS